MPSSLVLLTVIRLAEGGEALVRLVSLQLQASRTNGSGQSKLTMHISSSPSGIVRDQALHALGDGSPNHLEQRIIEAVEQLYNDPHPEVKKKARRMLNSYRRTGIWNVL